MRKMLVIAYREYIAAVRTKTFIISLVILPVLMGGSILVQWLLHGMVDTADKKFVLVNHAAPPWLLAKIKEKVDVYNQTKIFDADSQNQIKPRLVIEWIENAPTDAAAMAQMRFDLSEKAKEGKIVGFMEIIPRPAGKSGQGKTEKNVPRLTLRYQSNRPTYFDFSRFVEGVVAEAVRTHLIQEKKLPEAQVQTLLLPAVLETKGLSRRDPASGKITEATEQGRFAPIIVPFIMMMLMFMVVMMTATPLMQSVVEEKMQRIAEVLLGSVRPFELMMGKLVGMTGVSLTMTAVYLGGAYWTAVRYGFAEHISLELLVWFLVFQFLAEFMFGSLFIAVGAACTDMKETQNLLLPIMILICLPLFLLGTVIQEPNSPVVRAISFFPFATPTLMIARLAIPPGIPWWEALLGVVLVLVTTMACVHAAGRIFRVGILIQGKGARLSEMLKWIFRG